MTPAERAIAGWAPSSRTPLKRCRNGAFEPGERLLPEETPVALVHDASTSAVMMATPADLEDFAIGFSLTEGLIGDVSEVRELEIAEDPHGVEVRMWLAAERSAELTARRRNLVGPTGCGLCGVESLAQAFSPPAQVPTGGRITADQVQEALSALMAAQHLGAATRTVHAAGYWTAGQDAMTVREDVGRHNALDKLVGALARTDSNVTDGAVVLTSRVSVEMVQKAARLGAPILVAVSAPTALAVRTAEACGMTLIAVARQDGFEVFTGAERVAR
jgi:FdhD protein